jgi:hypothetical protein
MAEVAARPAGCVSKVFTNAASRQAAYDFVEHPAIHGRAVVEAVGDACARDSRNQRSVLVVLDGTSLCLADHQDAKQFGQLGTYRYDGRGLKVLNTLALTANGIPIGVPTQRYWARTARAKRGVYRPADERESVHWRRAVEDVSERFGKLAPAVGLNFIADREGDASLLMRHILERGHDFTIRANGTRKVQVGRKRVSLRPKLMRQQPVAHFWLHLPPRPGRAQREVKLELRSARVPLILRDGHIGNCRTQELTVVWARERGRPPAGEKKIEWLLYTNLTLRTTRDVCAVLQRYTYRWRIEEMHRTWKSGVCGAEDMQLRSVDAVTKWASMLGAVAARAERLKQLSREQPQQPASTELSNVELEALLLLKTEEKKSTEVLPDTTPTLAQAVRWLADLGGYIGSKSSGPPGSTAIARGLERVCWSAKAIEAFRKKR